MKSKRLILLSLLWVIQSHSLAFGQDTQYFGFSKTDQGYEILTNRGPFLIDEKGDITEKGLLLNEEARRQNLSFEKIGQSKLEFILDQQRYLWDNSLFIYKNYPLTTNEVTLDKVHFQWKHQTEDKIVYLPFLNLSDQLVSWDNERIIILRLGKLYAIDWQGNILDHKEVNNYDFLADYDTDHKEWFVLYKSTQTIVSDKGSLDISHRLDMTLPRLETWNEVIKLSYKKLNYPLSYNLLLQGIDNIKREVTNGQLEPSTTSYYTPWSYLKTKIEFSFNAGDYIIEDKDTHWIINFPEDNLPLSILMKSTGSQTKERKIEQATFEISKTDSPMFIVIKTQTNEYWESFTP